LKKSHNYSGQFNNLKRFKMKLVETSNWIQIDIDIDANFLVNPPGYCNNEFRLYHAFLTSYNIISHLIWKQSHIGTKPFLVLWVCLKFVYSIMFSPRFVFHHGISQAYCVASPS
jgi:hypothetical protein